MLSILVIFLISVTGPESPKRVVPAGWCYLAIHHDSDFAAHPPAARRDGGETFLETQARQMRANPVLPNGLSLLV